LYPIAESLAMVEFSISSRSTFELLKFSKNGKETESPSRNGRETLKCQRPLFVDEDSVSFPFLENFNNSKVERDGIENSTIANDFAIGYN
jgi:hypothetical protein